MGRFRGAAKPDTQPQSRTKRESSSRVPELDTSGWSLDTKLDLVGIGLMLFSLIMLLTSASGDQGQMMGAVNRFVGQIFGWGAVAVPLVMGGVGVFCLTPFRSEPMRSVGAFGRCLRYSLLTVTVIVVIDPLWAAVTAAPTNGGRGAWERGRGCGFLGSDHLFLRKIWRDAVRALTGGWRPRVRIPRNATQLSYRVAYTEFRV